MSRNTAQATLAAQNDAATINCLGFKTVSIQITGTWTGTITPEATNDGVNWFGVTITPAVSGAGVASVTANGAWTASAPFQQFRARLSTVGTGSAVVTLCRSPA